MCMSNRLWSRSDDAGVIFVEGRRFRSHRIGVRNQAAARQLFQCLARNAAALAAAAGPAHSEATRPSVRKGRPAARPDQTGGSLTVAIVVLIRLTTLRRCQW